MSGSSYCPMSAVYVHGTAPLSRIQATATEVSSPPENAMPTRSPVGREVRTLLIRFLSWVRGKGGRGWAGSVECSTGQAHESSYDVLAALGVAGDDHHRVVAGDGAEHVAELGLVEGAGEEVRRTRRRAQHDEVGARLRGDQQLLAQPRQPALAGRGLARGDRGAVAALGRHGVHQRP